MLTARYKALQVETDGSVAAFVVCGFPTCGAMLGEGTYDGSDVPAMMAFDSGYVQRNPGVWVLGRHAAKKFRKMPRRPRRSYFPSDETLVVRRGDGVLEARCVGLSVELLRPSRWWDGRAHQCEQITRLTRGNPLTVACGAHGHHSMIRFEDLERICKTARPREAQKTTN